MTNAKLTKRALVSSIISLVLCVSMFVGTTFAWFTDSVTSANNIIKSGNLDIELEYAVFDTDGTFKEWKDVKGASDILTNTLWEPGVTEVAYLRVANAGSLALKYQLGINIVSETGGVNVEGNPFKLSDHIQFGVVENVNGETGAYANREAAVAAVTGAKKISAGYTKSASMVSTEELYLALVVWMPTDVGNVANHNGTDVPTIELGINIVATQMNAEDDSFGNDYDEDAWADGMAVYSAQDLQAAINNGETKIVVQEDMNLTEPIVFPAAQTTYSARNNAVVLNLNGKTINAAYVEGSTTNHVYAFENYGNLVITGNGTINARGIFNYGNMVLENGTINAIDGNGGYAVRNYAGATFTMNGGTIATTYEDDNKVDKGGYDATTVRVDEGATFVMNGGTINNICDFTFAIDNYGDTTVNAGTIASVHSTVSSYRTLTINGGSFTCNGLEGVTAHTLVAWDGSTTTINGGTFDGKDNYNGFNVYADEGAGVVINGGNFLSVHSGSLYGEGTINVSGGVFFDDPTARLADGFQVVANGGNYYVVSNDVKKVILTAADLEAAFAAGGKYIVAANIELTEGITLAKGVEVVLNANGYTVASISTATGKNFQTFDVFGKLTVNGGTFTTEHTGDNMGWNNSTQVFNVVSGAELTLNNVYVKNLGGSDMAYAVNIGNNGGATLNTSNTTLESANYNALRVFNNAAGEIVVNLENGTVLTGEGSPLFVHFWTEADLGANMAARQADLTINFNDTKVSRYNGSQSLLRYGFTNAIYYNSTEQDTVVAGDGVALKWALANGKNVVLNNDITMEATESNGYGKTGIAVNGQTVNGNDYTLTVTNAGGTWDSAIYIKSGKIQNITVKGPMRGVFTSDAANGDIYLEKVTFANVVYTFNSDGTNDVREGGVYITDCNMNGWTSFSNTHEEVVFTNCTFGEGSGYKYCRPYNATRFVDCTFEAGYTIDKTKTPDITFENCTFAE